MLAITRTVGSGVFIGNNTTLYLANKTHVPGVGLEWKTIVHLRRINHITKDITDHILTITPEIERPNAQFLVGYGPASTTQSALCMVKLRDRNQHNAMNLNFGVAEEVAIQRIERMQCHLIDASPPLTDGLKLHAPKLTAQGSMVFTTAQLIKQGF